MNNNRRSEGGSSKGRMHAYLILVASWFLLCDESYKNTLRNKIHEAKRGETHDGILDEKNG